MWTKACSDEIECIFSSRSENKYDSSPPEFGALIVRFCSTTAMRVLLAAL
jgi:hypothetical protein